MISDRREDDAEAHGREYDDNKPEVQRAAYLVSRGFDQEEIAHLMSVNRSTVSRYLDRAYRSGLIRPRPPLFRSNLLQPRRWEEIRKHEETTAEARSRDLHKRLEALARPAADEYYAKHHPGEDPGRMAMIRAVHVIESGGTGVTPKEYDARIERMAGVAAGIFDDMLPRMRIVGVPWGAMMSGLVNGVQGFYDSCPRADNHVVFVPVAGETHDHPYRASSASQIAVRLHGIINGIPSLTDPVGINSKDSAEAPPMDPATKPLKDRLLGGVVARLPKALEPHAKLFREFLGVNSGYTNIIGQAPKKDQPLPQWPPLIERLDTLWAGAGAIANNRADEWYNETVHYEGLRTNREPPDTDDPSRRPSDQVARRSPRTKEPSHENEPSLDMLTCGDVCGIFVARGAAHERRVAEMNGRLTGLREHHLHDTAWRSREAAGATNGVVLFSLGIGKAEIVSKAIQKGWVNVLICDDELRKALLDRLPDAAATPARPSRRRPQR